jgi:hypothetical protein
MMRSKLISAMFVVSVLLCLLTMAMLGSFKGVHFTEAAGRSSVGFLVVAVSVVLPILSFRSAKTPTGHCYRRFFSPVFITTLLPAVIILWLVLDAAFVRFPGHIFPSDSSKISVGMTRAQVIENLGMFDTASGDTDGTRETFRYDVQRPWGFDIRNFHVRFREGKVVSAEFRTGIEADDLRP